MLVQQSGMTVHGSRDPLESRGGTEIYLRKIEVAKAAKRSLRKKLKMLGIRERHLLAGGTINSYLSAAQAFLEWAKEKTTRR